MDVIIREEASQKHDKALSGVTAAWPNNDDFSRSWQQTENIRRYRIRAIRTAKDLWAGAAAYAVGTFISSTSANNLVFEATAIAGTGTSGGAEPAWPDVIGESVVDNAGANQITWTARHADEVHLKFVEDATNEASEEAWLATAVDASSADVEYRKAFDGEYTEWVELSKDPDDLSLSRLGFLAIADTWKITVEAQ